MIRRTGRLVHAPLSMGHSLVARGDILVIKKVKKKRTENIIYLPFRAATCSLLKPFFCCVCDRKEALLDVRCECSTDLSLICIKPIEWTHSNCSVTTANETVYPFPAFASVLHSKLVAFWNAKHCWVHSRINWSCRNLNTTRVGTRNLSIECKGSKTYDCVSGWLRGVQERWKHWERNSFEGSSIILDTYNNIVKVMDR